MRLACLVLLLAFLSGPTLSKDCKTCCEDGCQTTFRIYGCGGMPKGGMEVAITVRCNGGSCECSKTTNARGEVTFDFCREKIINRQPRPNNPEDETCQTNGKESICTINMCNRKPR